MSKHTPGPWTVGASDHNPAQIMSASGSVAQVYGVPLHILIEDAPEGWGLSNARLIAAAPRMFARIEALAADGDPEAVAIMEAVNGRS